MAGESLNPGMGESSKIEKRIAAIERFIGRFKTLNIFAKNQFGKVRKYEILAKEGGFEKPELIQWEANKVSGTEINVEGGIITTQSDFTAITVEPVEKLKAEKTGYVILSINRDTNSRSLVGTPEISYADEDLPESDYNTQIIPLNEVTVENGVIKKIVQSQFGEIRIFEDLALVNGEFQLIGLEMSHRNHYDAPPA